MANVKDVIKAPSPEIFHLLFPIVIEVSSPPMANAMTLVPRWGISPIARKK
ncbi:hypothetical protein ACFL20_11445 [Spirochaetota bacterium]